jgi:predicted membrane chloride channel (bestrophin family)
MLYNTLGLRQHLGYYTTAFAPLIAFMLACIENIGDIIEKLTVAHCLERWSFACRQTARLVMLYITLLPFGLWQRLGHLTVEFAPLIAFMLACIENIGDMIENV